MVEHQPSKLDTWVRFPSPAYARVAQGWSTTLPRLGSRVRIPSRAFFISTISGNTKTKRTCHLRPVRFLFTMKCSMYGTLLEVSMNDLNILSSSPLFHQMMPEEISSILSCLSCRYAACEKNEFVCRHGDVLSFVGLVLSGEVHIIKEDFWGNRTILGKAEAGQLFAESYACAGRPLEVSVIASRDSEILFLDVRDLAPLLQSVLSVSSAPDPEFCHDPFPEKPDVDKKDRTHVLPFSSGQTALLSFRRIHPSAQHFLRSSVQPPAACRLSLRGPKRPFQGALPCCRRKGS